MSTILKWGGESKSRVLEETSKNDETEKTAQNSLAHKSLAVPLVIMILVGVTAIGVGIYQAFACESFLRITLMVADTIPFWISELALLSVLITSFFFIGLTVSRATDKLWIYIGLIWLLVFHIGPHLIVVYNVGTTTTPSLDKIIKSYDIHLRIAPNDKILPEWLEYIYDKHECCGIIYKQQHQEIMQDLNNQTSPKDPVEMKGKIYLISMDHTLRKHTCPAMEDTISDRARSFKNPRFGSEAKGVGAFISNRPKPKPEPKPEPEPEPKPKPKPGPDPNPKPKHHFISPKVSKNILHEFHTDFHTFMDELGIPSSSSDSGSNQYDGDPIVSCPDCESNDPTPISPNGSLADEKISLEGCAPAIEETYHSCISKCLHHSIFSAILGIVPFVCFVFTLRKAIKAKRIAKLNERKRKAILKRGVRFSEMDLKQSESKISNSQFDQRSDRYNISNSEKSEASLSEYETPSEDSISSLQSDPFGSQISRRSRSQSIISSRELEYRDTTKENAKPRNKSDQKDTVGGW